MNQIKILDCTLRDGGYINDWQFGEINAKNIISSLANANIDIIEIGYLSDCKKHNEGRTIYNTFEQMTAIIPNNRAKRLYVVMINIGEVSIEHIPDYDGKSVNGFRIVFHKKQLDDAKKFSEQLIKKGYKVFFQPMVAMSYTDDEFLKIIKIANELNPFAFYIVDSFGVMNFTNLMRFFYLIDTNLDREIFLGYHSHNNLQLAYSNAQQLAQVTTQRNLILDSSVYGMGRGAGNLNTELFAQFLNEVRGMHYLVEPLLKIIDSVLIKEFEKNYWGYSLPFYLSAKYNVHPNFSSYLSDKMTLSYEGLDVILSTIKENDKIGFSRELAEKYYQNYMNSGRQQQENYEELKQIIKGKDIVLVGPGQSINKYSKALRNYICKNQLLTISINQDMNTGSSTFIFLSNLRKLEYIQSHLLKKLIATSNIPEIECFARVDYNSLSNKNAIVEDNAGLMAMKLLKDLGAKTIYLAGIDGYDINSLLNYADEEQMLPMKRSVMESMNKGMRRVISEYQIDTDIQFLTPSLFSDTFLFQKED